MELILPFLGPEQEVLLTVSADAAQLDIHLSVDTTGSFSEEIDTIQRELIDRVTPTIRAQVADIGIGVSRFEDFPVPPYGQVGDHPFTLLTAVTTDQGRVGAAVAALSPLGNGGDPPEAGYEALYQIATGEGLTVGGVRYADPFNGSPAPGGGTLGGVGFREGSLRAVVHITDATSHFPADYLPSIPGTHSEQDAVTALGEAQVAVLGIASGRGARPHLERLAIATGATAEPTEGRCETGVAGTTHPPVGGVCPLVFDTAADGSGLSETLVETLIALLDTIRFGEAFGTAEDDDLGFVQRIDALDAMPPVGVASPSLADLHPGGDGIDDTFLDVRPGTELRFRAFFRNVRIRPADYEQVFRATIVIRGDGLVLERRVVRVVVPRRITPDAGPMDGGATDAADAADSAEDAFVDTGDGAIEDAGDSG